MNKINTTLLFLLSFLSAHTAFSMGVPRGKNDQFASMHMEKESDEGSCPEWCTDICLYPIAFGWVVYEEMGKWAKKKFAFHKKSKKAS